MIDNNGESSAVYSSMCEKDVFDIAKAPNTIVGSDGLTRAANEKGHPRAYATFPRAINYYVRENQIMSLEECINRMTGLSAERLKIKNKGVLKDGYDVDVLVIDYDKFYDRATYTDSNLLTDGIDYVIVNGEIVYHDKQLTGKHSGKFIQNNQ